MTLPLSHQRITVGVLASGGGRMVKFRGSSWTLIELRATFCGIPKYRLGERLRGMVDISGWTPGILVRDDVSGGGPLEQ